MCHVLSGLHCKIALLNCDYPEVYFTNNTHTRLFSNEHYCLRIERRRGDSVYETCGKALPKVDA